MTQAQTNTLAPVVIRLYQEADFQGVLAAICAAQLADRDPYPLSETDLRARLHTPHALVQIDPAQDVFVAQEQSAIVGYGDGVLRGNSGAWEYRTHCFVRPDWRRQGVGRALLERQWARARELAAQLPEIVFAARAFDTQPDALALFEAFSMQRARYFFTMRRDLAEPLPSLDTPPGLTLQTWAERRDDHAVWAASEEAFADHWGYQPTPFEAFEQMIQAARLQPDSSYVAWDGDQVVGGALNRMDILTAEQDRAGQIGWLFVRRPWRKRGLGRALLVAAMLHARQAGCASAILNVDAENLTGAVRLYESVGFKVAITRIVYRRVYPE